MAAVLEGWLFFRQHRLLLNIDEEELTKLAQNLAFNRKFRVCLMIFVFVSWASPDGHVAEYCIGAHAVLTLPTTPRPRTVSRVPDRLKILQCLSLS